MEKKPYNRTSNEVHMRYKEKNFDVIKFQLLKGQKATLQAIAAEKGIGQNDLICEALTAYTGQTFSNHK